MHEAKEEESLKIWRGLRRPPSHAGSVEHGLSDSGNSRGISILHDFVGISGLVHGLTYILPYDGVKCPASA